MEELASTISDRITDAVRTAILEGEYLPGDRLLLRDLTARYSVSATPVRAALNTLANEGLVVVEPHRGATVASLSREEVEDIFDIRARLEGLAIRAAVERMTPADVADLQAIAKQMERTDDVASIIRLNNEFHVGMYRLAGRPYLLQLLRSSRLRVQQYMRLYAGHGHRLEEAEQEHRLILAACAAGDGEQAARLVEAHVRSVVPFILEGVERMERSGEERRPA